MNYLTPEQVLFIHYRLIEETGGSHGIRDLSLLKSALSRSKATFDNNDLYPDPFNKAAALMQSIIKNHPFLDGNKRTAITTTSIFLLRNEYTLTPSNTQLKCFTFKVAGKNVTLQEIANWFKRYSKRK